MEKKEKMQQEVPDTEKTSVESTEKKSAEKKEKKKSSSKKDKEVETLTAELEKVKKESEELRDQHLRILAEYDNFRKRTAREKEELSSYCVANAIEKLLPALDALDAAENLENADVESLAKGIELVKKALLEGLKKCGVEEIPTEEGFDPNLHNALMHAEDENLPENTICEVFQKGYQINGKVIRHSLVKVAN